MFNFPVEVPGCGDFDLDFASIFGFHYYSLTEEMTVIQIRIQYMSVS